MIKSKVKVKKDAQKAIQKLEAINKRMKGPGRIMVGLPKDSNPYPDGTSVIMVGAVHEFGSEARKIPERSYLRTGVMANRKKYKRMFRKLTLEILRGNMDADKALQEIGLQAQTDVRQTLIDLKTPPLKSREGNPLYDTGHLVESIVFEVPNK